MMRERVLELLKKLVSIPSVSGQEAAIAETVEELLYGSGLSVRRQPVEALAFNILGSRGKGGPLLLSHLDVFPAYDHPEPFTPRVEGDEMIGRGTVDAKGQIAGLICALEHTTEPVEIALVVDEERTAKGSEVLELPKDCPGAVVLEPTSLNLCTSQAGSIEFRVVTSGTSAHGATPSHGVNAIDSALSIYRRLSSLPLLSLRSKHFNGGWVLLGRIEGGYEPMVIPTTCTMHIDIGFAPGVPASEAERQVREACSDVSVLDILDLTDGFELSEDSVVVRCLSDAFKRALGREPSFTGMPSWTDAFNLHRKGVEVIIFGAGELSKAHSDREAISIAQVCDMVRVLREFIRLW